MFLVSKLHDFSAMDQSQMRKGGGGPKLEKIVDVISTWPLTWFTKLFSKTESL